MKTAVVYYSMSGNCKFVAEQIATVLQCDQIRVEPVKTYPDKGARKFYWGGKSAIMGEKPELKPYDFNGDEYDCVIIGFPVWASNVTPPIRTFIAENDLSGMKIGAYACYMGGGGEKALEKLKKLLGREQLDAEILLIDPLKNDSHEVRDRIREFCIRLEK